LMCQTSEKDNPDLRNMEPGVCRVRGATQQAEQICVCKHGHLCLSSCEGAGRSLVAL
jgi:hypothetical protein